MKRIFIKIFLILGVFYYPANCSFPIRKAEDLQKNSQFLFMKSKFIPTNELEDSRNDLQNYRLLRKNLESLNFEDRNNYFILASKESKIEISEQGFLELLRERPKTKEPFINLIHLYFILEEYSEAKKVTGNWVTRNRISLNEFKVYLDILQKDNRWDERGMLLEAVSEISGYELYSWQELGKYFLFKKDYDSAEFYLQKVLQTLPFDEESLLTMAELCLDAGRWSELIDYGKAMHLSPGIKKYSYYFIGLGYYERQMYQEAISWLEKAPDEQKENLDFLMVWRDSILADNPRGSLMPLRKYFQKLKRDGLNISEEEFLPTLHPHGRETMDSFTR
ncbi:MAG: hypothetical protein JJT78_17425 [Leptospira sp.]|nr:hypothetical protein [Leptospira sp.]